jgi:hypothetical protein
LGRGQGLGQPGGGDNMQGQRSPSLGKATFHALSRSPFNSPAPPPRHALQPAAHRAT